MMNTKCIFTIQKTCWLLLKHIENKNHESKKYNTIRTPSDVIHILQKSRFFYNKICVRQPLAENTIIAWFI